MHWMWLVSVLVMIVVPVIVWLQLRTQYRIEVKTADKVKVVRHATRGTLQFLRKGLHFPGEYYREVREIDLSPQPTKSIEEFSDAGSMAGISLGSTEGVAEVEYDVLIGRESDSTTGGVLGDDPYNVESSHITDKALKSAFLKIQEIGDRVKREVASAIDQCFGRYLLSDFLEGKSFELDWRKVTGASESRDPTRRVKNKTEALQAMAETLEAHVNSNLINVGVNIAGLRITKVRPKDESLQKAREQKARNQARADAAQPLIDKGIPAIVAIGPDDKYAELTETDAKRYVAQQQTEQARLQKEGVVYQADAYKDIAHTLAGSVKINLADLDLAKAAEAYAKAKALPPPTTP